VRAWRDIADTGTYRVMHARGSTVRAWRGIADTGTYRVMHARGVYDVCMARHR